MSNLQNVTEKEILRATHLSLVEIIGGSIGHGFKIPLTGHVLSLYQLYILANSLNKDVLPRSSTAEISGIVAVLKSLSPAGQKLGPMLSILTQGLLFWLGTFVLGIGLLGQLLGAILLSLWSFIQPLLTYFLLFGADLIRMVDYYQQKIKSDYPVGENFLWIALGIVLLTKLLIACGVVILSRYLKKEFSINTGALRNVPNPKFKASGHPILNALRDLFNPLFIVSLILLAIFLWQVESNLSHIIWLLLRPVAIGFLFFYILRSPYTYRFFERVSLRSPAFNRFYQKAILVLKKIESSRQDGEIQK